MKAVGPVAEKKASFDNQKEADAKPPLWTRLKSGPAIRIAALTFCLLIWGGLYLALT